MLLLLSDIHVNPTTDGALMIPGTKTDIEIQRILSFEAVSVSCEEVTLTSFIV